MQGKNRLFGKGMSDRGVDNPDIVCHDLYMKVNKQVK